VSFMRYSLVAVACFICAGIISYLLSGAGPREILAPMQSQVREPAFPSKDASSPATIPSPKSADAPTVIPPNPAAFPRKPNPPNNSIIQGAGNAYQPDADCRKRMLKLGVASTGPCVDVSEIVENLASGQYLFNKPDTAYVDTPFHITLVLKTSPKQDVMPLLSGMPGQVAQREGKFAQSVEATLHGDDLTIDPSGSQARTATTVEPVTWEWTITPKTGGQKTLVLEVVANIQAGSDSHKVQIKTLREPIQVSVSGFQQIKAFVADANGFLVAAGAAVPALAAIIGLVPPIRKVVTRWWQRRSSRRRSGETA
jgi:hypothetical protein